MPATDTLNASLTAANLAVFYSPIIVIFLVVGYSLTQNGYKGIIYIVIILIITAIRVVVYNNFPNADPLPSQLNLCNQVQFAKNGNSSLSAYIFGFTIMYLILPMINNGDINIVFLSGWLFYLVVDYIYRLRNGCLSSVGYFGNLVLGAGLGTAFVYILYQIQSGKYLFFNEFSSNSETCTMPSKQQFKCFVMQNGQEISEVPS